MRELKSFFGNLEFHLISLIAFAIPLEKRLVPYVIALYVVYFLFSGNLREKGRRIISSQYVWISSTYYFFLIVGIFYSEQWNAALFDLEVKFSLLIFPLMIVNLDIDKKELGKILAWFIAGCFLAFIICLSYAVTFFYINQDSSIFFYNKLSVFHHPTYFSLYLNFAILILYYYMIFDSDSFVIKSVFLYVLLIVIFSIFVVLLSSKIGLIALLMIIFFGTLFWFLKSWAVFPSILVFTMLTTMIYFSFKYSSIIQGRIQEAVVSLTEEKAHQSTTGARLLIWKIGYEMILDEFIFGYGTGDVKYELVKRYKEKNYEHLYNTQLNAHNQFVQAFIGGGLIGFTMLCLYLFFAFKEKQELRNFLFSGFVIMITIYFLTESMLETQAGVVFYAFFNAILYFNRDKLHAIKSSKL